MIIALILPNLTKVGIFIDFKINQDFIAKVLCINRDKPMTTCNGKCYLTDQLRKAEEEEQKQAPQRTKENVENLYCHQETDIFKTTDFFEKQSLNKYLNNLYSFSFITDIFHPPKLNLI